MVREPTWTRQLRDLLWLLFFGLLLAGVSAAVILPPSQLIPIIDIPLRIFLGLLAELTLLFILRELVPKPQPGAHRIGLNRAYLAWLASSTLSDVALHPLVRAPFWSLRLGQVLYLKVLGAQIDASVSLTPHIELRDPALLSIGPGAQIETGVTIETALFGAGRVRVAPVQIGPGALVGARCLLLPGSNIAKDSHLGPNVVVGEGAMVGVGASVEGQVHLGRDANLGSYVSVGSLAAIGDGVIVGDRARVPPGSWVDADISERGQWVQSQEISLRRSSQPGVPGARRREQDIETTDLKDIQDLRKSTI